MRVHRVFLYNPDAAPGESGHPTYLHLPAQGRGRWDNPDLYRTWYVSTSREGAIGESFGNLAEWTPGMLAPALPGLGRAIATLNVPDGLRVFDFDDGQRLVDIQMRPSQVVRRNYRATQRTAARLFEDGSWDGLSWWSFHRPEWTSLALWQDPEGEIPFEVDHVEPLTMDSPGLAEAAAALNKIIIRA